MKTVRTNTNLKCICESRQGYKLKGIAAVLELFLALRGTLNDENEKFVSSGNIFRNESFDDRFKVGRNGGKGELTLRLALICSP